jgi:hypothetical protein
MQTQTKQVGLLIALIILMFTTRGSHFGSAFSLPDASLAIFLIAGFMLARFTLTALSAFVILLLVAGGMDYYAIAYNEVSDYCVSPAYWFLIPTYASMWLAGHWFASRKQNNWRSLALFGGVSLFSTSLAFLISNGAFYTLSGKFSDMNIAEYATRVAKYYPSYASGALMYLAIAAAIYILVNMLQNSATSTAR